MDATSLPPARPGLHLWLARHAQVDEAWVGRAYGDADVPLSPAGEAASLALAESLADLRPDRLLASPLARARHLGEALAAAAARRGRPLELELVPDLREVQRGRWQGIEFARLWAEREEEMRARLEDPWGYEGHGGESDARLLARVLPPVARALAELGRGLLVVASHHNVARVLLAHLLGVPPRRSLALRLDTARASLLVGAADGWRLAHHNVAAPGALEARDEGLGRPA